MYSSHGKISRNCLECGFVLLSPVTYDMCNMYNGIRHLGHFCIARDKIKVKTSDEHFTKLFKKKIQKKIKTNNEFYLFVFIW